MFDSTTHPLYKCFIVFSTVAVLRLWLRLMCKQRVCAHSRNSYIIRAEVHRKNPFLSVESLNKFMQVESMSMLYAICSFLLDFFSLFSFHFIIVIHRLAECVNSNRARWKRREKRIDTGVVAL